MELPIDRRYLQVAVELLPITHTNQTQLLKQLLASPNSHNLSQCTLRTNTNLRSCCAEELILRTIDVEFLVSGIFLRPNVPS